MGDLYRDLGEGQNARDAYLKALAIRERLAAAEPERADYQRDLSVSYSKMGDLYRDLGEGQNARDAYLKALAIAERLAAAEPERADYQRDLTVSNERLGDTYKANGDLAAAHEAFSRSLAHLRTPGRGRAGARSTINWTLWVALTRLGRLEGAGRQSENRTGFG